GKRVFPFGGVCGLFYALLLDRGWSSMHVALGAYAVPGALLVIGWLCIHPDWKISVLLLFVVAFLFAVSLRNFESIRHKSHMLFGSQQATGNSNTNSDD